MSAIGDAEPGAYVDIALDFTPMGGAFQGFMGVLEYDETKLSYVCLLYTSTLSIFILLQ